MYRILLILLALASTGCEMPTQTPIPTAGQCTYRQAGQILQDAHCTPGVVDSRVTQANIKQTICRPGYSASVRPPVSFTEPLKLQQMRAYAATGSASDYELDHLIPLEIGGDPRSSLNLWPEPIKSANLKDTVENKAHDAVCSGAMALVDAQQQISEDWVQLGRTLHVPGL